MADFMVTSKERKMEGEREPSRHVYSLSNKLFNLELNNNESMDSLLSEINVLMI